MPNNTVNTTKRLSFLAFVIFVSLLMTACTFGFDPDAPSAIPTTTGGSVPDGDNGTVVQVIDGDTIDVQMDSGSTIRVRYIGVNTPERDETCYSEATQANKQLVSGQTVRLVADAEDEDRYGRSLRYIYVGSTFVNAELVRQGFAEVVSYPPNTAQYDTLKGLEIEAASANRGCHATGIFDDGSYTR